LENFGKKINARSKYLGGKQQLVTPDRHVIPLPVRGELMQMDMCPPTESEMRTLEHVYFTSDSPWDPKCIDIEATIGASHDDASDVPAFLDQEKDQEAIDSLNFEENVNQCLLYINLHSFL
jgi:hypothetical protein